MSILSLSFIAVVLVAAVSVVAVFTEDVFADDDSSSPESTWSSAVIFTGDIRTDKEMPNIEAGDRPIYGVYEVGDPVYVTVENTFNHNMVFEELSFLGMSVKKFSSDEDKYIELPLSPECPYSSSQFQEIAPGEAITKELNECFDLTLYDDGSRVHSYFIIMRGTLGVISETSNLVEASTLFSTQISPVGSWFSIATDRSAEYHKEVFGWGADNETTIIKHSKPVEYYENDDPIKVTVTNGDNPLEFKYHKGMPSVSITNKATQVKLNMNTDVCKESSMYRTVDPRTSFVIPFDLSECFDLSPGDYTIKVEGFITNTVGYGTTIFNDWHEIDIKIRALDEKPPLPHENLLDRPKQLSSWKVTSNGGYGWHDHIDSDVFGTSYGWNQKQQTIPLLTFDKVPSPKNVNLDYRLVLTEDYSRTYCGDATGGEFVNKESPYDRYYLKMSILDSSGNMIAERSTGLKELDGPCVWDKDWQTASLTFDPDELPQRTAIQVVVEHGGISGEYWKGNYGPAMKGIKLSWEPNT